jgi:hypothetical protein
MDIASEAGANRSMTLEIIDKTLRVLDHTANLDKIQHNKEELHYATKKIHLPTTHGSSPAGLADIETLNWEHSIEYIKPQENIIQELNEYTKEASDKPLEKSEYETKTRRILNVKKLEIMG